MNLDVVKSYFGAVDVIVFATTLFLAVVIGAYYGYKDRKKTPANYYFGGKKMSPFPVGISTAVSFISALTVMTYPSDTYTYGSVVFWYAFSTVIPVTTACLYFIPLYHRLQLRTIYQYLEDRFSVTIRKFSSAIEIINQTFYMGITIYLPALALNAVTPLHLHWTIALTGTICTFYTSLGGIKAVIWTDTLQALVMLLGVLAALIKATLEIGGLGNAWKSLERNDANNFWNFDPDPRVRTTFWTIIFGMGCVQTTIVCVNQSVAQRYLSCKSTRQAQKAAVITLLPKITISLSCILGGVMAFAYFEGCDPVKSKLLAKPEQIMPYLVLVLFRNLPGLAGLYVAAVFSATLSTVSSGINALAAQLLEDFVLPIKHDMSINAKLIFSKTTVLLFGVTVTGIAYIATVMSGSVIKIVYILKGACGGPMVGVFFLAMFFPWATSKGALAGQIIGTLLSTWLAIGSFIYGASPKFLRKVSTSTNSCFLPTGQELYNLTTPRVLSSEHLTTLHFTEENMGDHHPALYSLSFAYNSVVGMLSCIVVGLFVSFVTGANKPSDIDPRFFVPLVDNKYLPESVQSFFRFGVRPLCRNPKSEDPERLLKTVQENKI